MTLQFCGEFTIEALKKSINSFYKKNGEMPSKIEMPYKTILQYLGWIQKIRDGEVVYENKYWRHLLNEIPVVKISGEKNA